MLCVVRCVLVVVCCLVIDVRRALRVVCRFLFAYVMIVVRGVLPVAWLMCIVRCVMCAGQ